DSAASRAGCGGESHVEAIARSPCRRRSRSATGDGRDGAVDRFVGSWAPWRPGIPRRMSHRASIVRMSRWKIFYGTIFPREPPDVPSPRVASAINILLLRGRAFPARRWPSEKERLTHQRRAAFRQEYELGLRGLA